MQERDKATMLMLLFLCVIVHTFDRPPYVAATDTLLRLDTATNGGVRPQAKLRKEACDFWEGHAVAATIN